MAVDAGGVVTEKEINYIPFRFIIAILITVVETAAVVGIVVAMMYIPFFSVAVVATQIFVLLNIINSDDNPDYKIPWLLVVLLIPVAGFMIYFM